MIFIPIILGVTLSTAWMIYEFYTAPLMDDNGNFVDKDGNIIDKDE